MARLKPPFFWAHDADERREASSLLLAAAFCETQTSVRDVAPWLYKWQLFSKSNSDEIRTSVLRLRCECLTTTPSSFSVSVPNKALDLDLKTCGVLSRTWTCSVYRQVGVGV